MGVLHLAHEIRISLVSTYVLTSIAIGLICFTAPQKGIICSPQYEA